ncbi:hypothetical protein GWC77_24100 [Paraburkholderia sp. NMBU_R16]|nr:hypothetical protein [Paraburkholderia sp. NMBU_R16]
MAERRWKLSSCPIISAGFCNNLTVPRRVFHRGRRVTSHTRNGRAGGYTTVVEHMLGAHRVHLELDQN